MAILLQTAARRVLIHDPAGIHRIHVDTIFCKVGSGRVGQHVQGGLGHIGVGMATAFFKPQEIIEIREQDTRKKCLLPAVTPR